MSVSVIIRVRDEAVALERCLALIGSQTGAGANPELIIVDNDSGDDSAAVARRHGAQVIRISRERFSFGRALNLGASVAHSSRLVALSAHAYIRDRTWLERVVAPLDDPQVVAVSGERFWPDGSPLLRAVRYDARLARGYPRWGYSNAAGAFRAQAWSERHFREDLPGAEDREWARHWALSQDRVTHLAPDLLVDHDHTHDPVDQIFTRSRREAVAYAMYLGAPDRRRSLVSEWFSDTRFYVNPWRARLSHRRVARLLGERVGAFEGRFLAASQPSRGSRSRIARLGLANARDPRAASAGPTLAARPPRST